MNKNNLVKKYIFQINTKHHNTKRLFAIGMIGVTGVGKSYIAEILAQNLGLYIASNDRIRRFLNDEGYGEESPEQLLLQDIAEQSSKYLYDNQISHIIDADLIKFYDVAKKNARKHKAKFYLIRVICSEKLILQRLKKRKEKIQRGDVTNLSRVSVEEYLKRKKIH